MVDKYPGSLALSVKPLLVPPPMQPKGVFSLSASPGTRWSPSTWCFTVVLLPAVPPQMQWVLVLWPSRVPQALGVLNTGQR